MDAPEPRRRWYRKKRWWVAGAVFLGSQYLVVEGPARYAATRGWVSERVVAAVFRPAGLTDEVPYADDLRRSYLLKWARAADAHTPDTRIDTVLWGRQVTIVAEGADPGRPAAAVGTSLRGEPAVFVSGREIRMNRYTIDGEVRDYVWVNGREVMRLPPGTRRIEIDGCDGVVIRAGGKTVRVE